MSSAAEKLKARDTHGFPVVTDADLRRALSQIVAVVEKGNAVIASQVEESEDFLTTLVDKQSLYELSEALDALSEQLGDVT